MSDSENARRLLLVRGLLSLPFLAVSLILFLTMGGRSFIAALGYGLIAVCLMIIPAFLLAPPLADLASGPMSSFYNPREKRSSPALMFSQPEACILRGKYEKAMEHLRSMVLIDPSRAQVYIRMIDLALRHQGDHEAARAAFREGMGNLEEMEKRNYLAEEYRRLRLLFPEHPVEAPGKTAEESRSSGGSAFGWSSRRGRGRRNN